MADSTLVRRSVYLGYIAIAVIFVLISTRSLVRGVFGTPEPLEHATPAGKACADGVRSLAAALDRGLSKAASQPDATRAVATFHEALAPEWNQEDAVAAPCKADPHGTDAYAALVRLRRAEESFLARQIAEIAPIRRDVEAYLPH